MVAPRALQKADEDDDHAARLSFVTLADNGEIAQALSAGAVDIVAGTAWVFARPEFDAALDVLFVDEAGQMSGANIVAIGTSARSIVVVGDPNQLPMVTQGVHPEGASASALQHLLADAVTVPPDRGILLDTTWRMHPAVNDYISPTFYEDRLLAHPSTARQVLHGTDPVLSDAGLRWWPVAHEGNGPRSPEEADVVAGIVSRLLGEGWTDSKGQALQVGIDDIIVVAPYNAQVAEIQAALLRETGHKGNVGTVDKFQGREGIVAIYSMASSTRDDAPRDMSFLYSPNRLNVAVSRARSLAIIVASPRLLEAGCRTPEQMRSVAALCGFVEMAVTGPHPSA